MIDLIYHCELFFSDVSLWNQYKFIAVNIFVRKILLTSCKIFAVISNETTNELTIYAIYVEASQYFIDKNYCSSFT